VTYATGMKLQVHVGAERKICALNSQAGVFAPVTDLSNL